MSSLSDKTVLVTGASGGIGLETAKMLSLAGAKVVGCARRLDVLEAEMKSLPGPAIAVHVDVADRLSVESLMDRIPDEWRSIMEKWERMGVNELTFRTAESDLENLEAHMNAIKKMAEVR